MNSSAPIPKLTNTAAPASSPVTAPGTGLVATSGASLHLPSYLLGLTTALILLGAALFFWPRPQLATVQLQPPPTSAPTPPAPTAQATAPPAPLVVFVSGAVAQPGLYTVAPTARIGDALAAAGGLLPNVDPALINQAQPVVDGAQLHIPVPTTVPTTVAILTQATPSVESTSGSAPDSGEAAPAAEPVAVPAAIVAAPTQPPVAVAEPPAGLSTAAPLALPTPTAALAVDALPARSATVNLSAGGGLINVNTATSAELETLPAIGPAKAQAIIANRPFATVDELDRVPGIGAATLEQIRPYVTTE